MRLRSTSSCVLQNICGDSVFSRTISKLSNSFSRALSLIFLVFKSSTISLFGCFISFGLIAHHTFFIRATAIGAFCFTAVIIFLATHCRNCHKKQHKHYLVFFNHIRVSKLNYFTGNLVCH